MRVIITRNTQLYKTMTKEEWANMLKVAANRGWAIVLEGEKWTPR